MALRFAQRFRHRDSSFKAMRSNSRCSRATRLFYRWRKFLLDFWFIHCYRSSMRVRSWSRYSAGRTTTCSATKRRASASRILFHGLQNSG